MSFAIVAGFRLKTSVPASPANTSPARVLSILDLFSLDQPLQSAEHIATHLGLGRSTAYRYLRELCDAGLLAPVALGLYSLGPRVIELERLSALTDPLYRAGQTVLDEVACGNRVLMLNAYYGGKVLCIYKVGPETLVQDDGVTIRVQKVRGMPFPLFTGAASVVMLANLSANRMREVYLRSISEVSQAGLGDNWDAFRRNMAQIRKRGWATSAGTVTPRLSGVAVPVLLQSENKVVGSLAETYSAAAAPMAPIDERVAGLRLLGERIALAYTEATAARPR